MVHLLRHMNYHFSVVRVAFVVLALPALALSVSVIATLSLSRPVVAAPAPVVDAAAQGPALKDLQSRIKRIETRFENQGLVDLISRFEQLQSDMERIVGDLEVQSHQLRTLQKQQKDVYADIDRRLRKLEQSSKTGVPVSPSPLSGSGGMPVSPVPVQPAGSLGSSGAPSRSSGGTVPTHVPTHTPSQNANNMSEVERNVARSAYERAFNLLKQRRYDMAITSFKAFLDTYPYASYADNAQYWLGEASYANRNYKVALSEFKKVIEKYPNSPKRADAMLKIGYTYVELGENKSAMEALNTIVKSYPGSTAAKLAQKRIKTLNVKR